MSGATQSLAAQAAALWQQHDYKQCITVLKQLQGQNPDDCKVRHNLALAEYHAGGCCQAQQLLAALQAVKNTAETRAKEVAERLQRAASPTASSPAAASGSGKGAASPTKGAAAAAAADVAAASVMHVEDTDASLVTLNMAAIHFQMKQHAAALALLEELYRDIEPISEVAALRVCLLLLEIYLAADQPEKAAGVLGYVEKTYGLTTDRSDDKVSSEQHSDADTAADPDGMSTPKHSTMAAELAKVEGSPGSAALGSGGDAEDLAASFGRSLLLGSQGMLDGRTATQGDRHIKVAGLEVGQLVHIYKARLHLQTHNLKAAKREIKAILAADPTSPQGLSLKAQLEYLRHNYRKAAKLLTAVPTASRDSPPTASNASTSGSGPPQPQPPADPAAAAMSRVTMLCNMGAVQHSQGKHHTAALCFSTALKAAADAVAAGSAEFSDSQQGSGRQSQSVAGSSTSSQNADQDQRLPLPVFARDVRLQVVYNAGLQALMLRRYASGLQCFEEASAAFYNRPLLWLRMAECAIGLHHEQQPQGSAAAAHAGHALGLPAGDASVAAQQNRLGGPVPTEPSQAWLQQAEQYLRNAKTLVEGLQQALDAPEEDPAADLQLQQALLASFAQNQASSGAGPSTATAEPVSQQRQGSSDAGSTSGQAAGAAAEAPSSSNGTMPGAGPLASVRMSGGAAAAAAKLAMMSLDRSKEQKSASGAVAASVAAAKLERRRELATILAATLANLAYVALLHGAAGAALTAAQRLLLVPGLSKADQFLGHCYAAEALCLQDRVAEAATHLTTALAQQQAPDSALQPSPAQPMLPARPEAEPAAASAAGRPSAGSAGSVGTSRAASPAVVVELTGPAARRDLLVNLASVYALQGDLVQAQQAAAKAATLDPACPQALLMLVYVELSRGNTGSALQLLKQQRMAV